MLCPTHDSIWIAAQITIYYDELRSAHPRIAWSDSKAASVFYFLSFGTSTRLELPINDRQRPDGYEYWPLTSVPPRKSVNARSLDAA